MFEKFSAVKADKSDFMQYNHRTIRILDRRHIVAQLFPLSFLTTTSYNEVHIHSTVLTLWYEGILINIQYKVENLLLMIIAIIDFTS